MRKKADKTIEIRRTELNVKIVSPFFPNGMIRNRRHLVPAWDVIDTLTKCRYPCLTWAQAQAKKKELLALPKETVGFTRVNSDTNGNPRYVVDYSWFCTVEELDHRNGMSLFEKRAAAHQRALSIGYSKYRGKDFMGGFVASSYSLKSDCMHMSRVTGRRFVDFGN